jgi:hypothetical protein
MKEVEDKRAEKLVKEKPVPATITIVPESKEDWRMEVWTPEGPQVYQWRDGSPTPELLDPEAKKNSPKPSTDYSYLSGSQSPFFAQPTGAKPPVTTNAPVGPETNGTSP